MIVTTVMAKSDGSFQSQTPTPSTPNLGMVNVTAIGVTSHLLAVTTTTEPADVIPNPMSAMIGSTVQVIGGEYDKNERITLLLRGSIIATVTTNSLGSFSTNFTVSNAAGPGAAAFRLLEKRVDCMSPLRYLVSLCLLRFLPRVGHILLHLTRYLLIGMLSAVLDQITQ